MRKHSRILLVCAEIPPLPSSTYIRNILKRQTGATQSSNRFYTLSSLRANVRVFVAHLIYEASAALFPVASLKESRLRLKCDGTRAETRVGLSAKQTSPFTSAGASVQSTTGRRGVLISGSNDGYTMFRGNVRVLATHSIRQFPLHFPSRASPCAIMFQLDSTSLQCQLTCSTCLSRE